MNLIRTCLITMLIVLNTIVITAQEKQLPYKNDPVILEKIKNLGDRQGLRLPNPKIMSSGKILKTPYRGGPYSRDYTNKMVHAPERESALYCGGNHGSGRTNDVWEYHLGSNTWHRLHAPIGGDHAKHKLMLQFMRRQWKKNLNKKFNEKEQKQFDAAKSFWKKYVVFKDGHCVTKIGEAPLMVGHTWDTLVYEPNVGLLIQGTGAHCGGGALNQHKFGDMPLDVIKKTIGKNSKGIPYKSMWTFDPIKKKWGHYASNDKLARLRGMGAAMCYIPEWKKIIFYVSAQNVTPQAHMMITYDAINDKWANLRPNNGRSIRDLVHKDKVAPSSEQQTAYSSKHKKMYAILKSDLFCYDILSNKWTKLCTDKRIYGHDAKTIFAYDSVGDVLILAGPRQKTQFAIYDIKSNKWEVFKPTGSKMTREPWGEGKGYYDPKHNVFVLHNKGLWLYRHKKK